MLLRGNHDFGLDAETAPFPVSRSCFLEHGGREFYCIHRPKEIPDDWDEWAIHGHIHNNDKETYPFVAADARRVNVSSELLNYRPLALKTLTGVFDACPDGSRIRDRYRSRGTRVTNPTSIATSRQADEHRFSVEDQLPQRVR